MYARVRARTNNNKLSLRTRSVRIRFSSFYIYVYTSPCRRPTIKIRFRVLVLLVATAVRATENRVRIVRHVFSVGSENLRKVSSEIWTRTFFSECSRGCGVKTTCRRPLRRHDSRGFTVPKTLASSTRGRPKTK